jgi:hypothetical protein
MLILLAHGVGMGAGGSGGGGGSSQTWISAGYF